MKTILAVLALVAFAVPATSSPVQVPSTPTLKCCLPPTCDPTNPNCTVDNGCKGRPCVVNQ